MYHCYLIYSKKFNCTYIGITDNLERRIKQHNGYLKGGAKATKKSQDWMYYIIVSGFNCKSETCSFEWLWKHQKNKYDRWTKTSSGIKKKLSRLINLLLEDKWKHLTLIGHHL